VATHSAKLPNNWRKFTGVKSWTPVRYNIFKMMFANRYQRDFHLPSPRRGERGRG
jgi:hypothetical protein